MSTHIWLRSETKPSERRTVLTPQHARQLVEAGFQLTVEKSSQSSFDWRDYEPLGCRIVDEHAWKSEAPIDAIILGLKELETSNEPLAHRHIHFAHVYKEQSGWRNVLDRYSKGGGRLYDLEYLVDETGRRIAAFGHWAGFAGAALAVKAWRNWAAGTRPILGKIESQTDQAAFVEQLKNEIQKLERKPKAIVIGAQGRCGRGAIELLDAVGVEVTGWDLPETKSGGPFREILDHDIFLNCVFVEKAMPPFIDHEIIKDQNRKLNLICDVSCDPYGEYNPVPIYDHCTTFSDPYTTIIDSTNPLYLIAIDHLPSFLPRESSEDYCQQLMPHLLQLDNLQQGVWSRAAKIFDSKMSLVQNES